MGGEMEWMMQGWEQQSWITYLEVQASPRIANSRTCKRGIRTIWQNFHSVIACLMHSINKANLTQAAGAA